MGLRADSEEEFLEEFLERDWFSERRFLIPFIF